MLCPAGRWFCRPLGSERSASFDHFARESCPGTVNLTFHSTGCDQAHRSCAYVLTWRPRSGRHFTELGALTAGTPLGRFWPQRQSENQALLHPALMVAFDDRAAPKVYAEDEAHQVVPLTSGGSAPVLGLARPNRVWVLPEACPARRIVLRFRDPRLAAELNHIHRHSTSLRRVFSRLKAFGPLRLNPFSQILVSETPSELEISASSEDPQETLHQ
jgi:hypothetical protein